MLDFIYKEYSLISEEEAILVLNWRNSDRVRLKMTNTEIISEEQHFRWLESLKKNKNSIYYLVYYGNDPIGCINHINLDFKKKSASGGSFIGNDKFSGFGFPLLYFGYLDLFENLGIERSYAQVLRTNTRVYSMHKKLFFAKDLIHDELYFNIIFDLESWKKMKNAYSSMIKTSFLIKDVRFLRS